MAGHYPVKRRGQRRRLDPNWDAIRWLEDETLDDTEIVVATPVGLGMIRLITLGWYTAKGRKMYPRRMFEVFALEASSTTPVTYTPCEACDNYAYTWACTEHPEVSWDAERQDWTPHPAPWAVELCNRMLAQEVPNPPGLVNADPNQGRPGYRYDPARNQWVPPFTHVRGVAEW